MDERVIPDRALVALELSMAKPNAGAVRNVRFKVQVWWKDLQTFLHLLSIKGGLLVENLHERESVRNTLSENNGTYARIKHPCLQEFVGIRIVQQPPVIALREIGYDMISVHGSSFPALGQGVCFLLQKSQSPS